MSNPTSNYSFQMPTNTDLVYQLPADFEVFGQAVDTQMKTNADAATQKATLTTKGDLYAASAASTPARLAVGTNGQVLTADSTAATGLAWATAAASSGPAFFAYRDSSSQSFSSGTETKVQFNAEQFDTDNCFDSTTNYRFTPNKAGYYQISGHIQMNTTVSFMYLAVKKNGSSWAVINRASLDYSGPTGSTLVYLNGSTDYVELFVQVTGTSPQIGYGAPETWFAGVWIRS